MPSGADVARVLREARDLMNSNGRHWIQGDMTVEITESLISARDNPVIGGGFSISPKAQVGDIAFCAWGGIAEVADEQELRVEAMEALVDIIEPNGLDGYYGEIKSEAFYDWEDEFSYSVDTNGVFHTRYPSFAHYWADKLDYREEILGEYIASWNDSNKRTWEDVRNSLTQAAARAKKRG